MNFLGSVSTLHHHTHTVKQNQPQNTLIINVIFYTQTHPPEILWMIFTHWLFWIIDFTLICDITWVKGKKKKNYIKPRFKFVFTLERKLTEKTRKICKNQEVVVFSGWGRGISPTDFFLCCLLKIRKLREFDPFKTQISTKKYNDLGRETEF